MPSPGRATILYALVDAICSLESLVDKGEGDECSQVPAVVTELSPAAGFTRRTLVVPLRQSRWYL